MTKKAYILLPILVVLIIGLGREMYRRLERSDTTYEAGWRKFKSANGRFTVSMPGPVKQIVDTSELLIGHQALAMDGDAVHSVSYFDLPAVEFVFDDWKKGILSRLEGAEVVEDSEMRLDGTYPGRALKLRRNAQNKTSWIRVYVVGTRAYQLYVTAPGPGDEAAAKRFFDSFACEQPALPGA